MVDEVDYSIGDIVFEEFEAQPTLGDLGARQQMAIFHYVGGVTSVQLLGPVPQMITLQGLLLGESAEDRAKEIKKLATDSEPVTLTYSGFSFYGVVEIVEINIDNIYEIKFVIKFHPVEDQSSGGADSGADVPSKENTLNQSMMALEKQIYDPFAGIEFEEDVQKDTEDLNKQINTALNNNNGLVNQIPISQNQTLQQQIENLKTKLQGYVTSGTPEEITSAQSALISLDIMKQNLNASVPPLKEITVVNPNLFLLASQFYEGDISAWQYIAESNGLQNPINEGVFNLRLPTQDFTPPSESVLYR